MQIGELVAASGVPLATIKYYIREGMLPAGETDGARRATYDEEHLGRLRLIRALLTVAELPLSRIKAVLDLLDHGETDTGTVLRKAIGAIGDPSITEGAPTPRASEAIGSFVPGYAPLEPAMSMLEKSLDGIDAAGFAVSPERLRLYSQAMLTIAESEVEAIPAEPHEAIRYTVLGTVVVEPLLVAMRRLAQQSLASGR